MALFSNEDTPKVITIGQAKGVESIAFSNDNHWLAVSSRELFGETVLLADLTTQGIPTFPVETNRSVLIIKFIENKNFLFADGEIITLDKDQLIEIACAKSGRNLSQSEWLTNFQGEDYRFTCPNILIIPNE